MENEGPPKAGDRRFLWIGIGVFALVVVLLFLYSMAGSSR